MLGYSANLTALKPTQTKTRKKTFHMPIINVSSCAKFFGEFGSLRTKHKPRRSQAEEQALLLRNFRVGSDDSSDRAWWLADMARDMLPNSLSGLMGSVVISCLTNRSSSDSK